jgi:hypothetical protein
MLPPVHHQQQDADKREHPEELRTQGERRCGHHEREERKDRGGPHVQAATDGDQARSAEDRPDEHRAEDGEADPAADRLDRPKEDLGRPLLVDPRLAGHGEGPGVGRRDPAGRQDLCASTELVGEIDGRDLRD